MRSGSVKSLTGMVSPLVAEQSEASSPAGVRESGSLSAGMSAPPSEVAGKPGAAHGSSLATLVSNPLAEGGAHGARGKAGPAASADSKATKRIIKDDALPADWIHVEKSMADGSTVTYFANRKTKATTRVRPGEGAVKAAASKFGGFQSVAKAGAAKADATKASRADATKASKADATKADAANDGAAEADAARG